MPAPTIGLIYAQACHRVIGHQGQMPWHLPEDLTHFRQVTAGQPVLMGRKTWDSLPERFRPLPGRRNLVLTRRADWNAPGAEVVHTLPEAIARTADAGQLWVIGGGELYAQALPLATQLWVTEIDLVVDGDTHAPDLTSWLAASPTRSDACAWQVSARSTPPALRYRFVHHTRHPE